MAIDPGKVRTGLAICDKNEILAFPLTVIIEKNINVLSDKIAEKVTETKTELLVIGLPLNMNGTLGESAKNSLTLKKIMETKIKIPIITWDERRTTICANQYLNEINVRGEKRKSIIDSLSASIILENYLCYRKSTIK